MYPGTVKSALFLIVFHIKWFNITFTLNKIKATFTVQAQPVISTHNLISIPV